MDEHTLAVVSRRRPWLIRPIGGNDDPKVPVAVIDGIHERHLAPEGSDGHGRTADELHDRPTLELQAYLAARSNEGSVVAVDHEGHRPIPGLWNERQQGFPGADQLATLSRTHPRDHARPGGANLLGRLTGQARLGPKKGRASRLQIRPRRLHGRLCALCLGRQSGLSLRDPCPCRSECRFGRIPLGPDRVASRPRSGLRRHGQLGIKLGDQALGHELAMTLQVEVGRLKLGLGRTHGLNDRFLACGSFGETGPCTSCQRALQVCHGQPAGLERRNPSRHLCHAVRSQVTLARKTLQTPRVDVPNLHQQVAGLDVMPFLNTDADEDPVDGGINPLLSRNRRKGDHRAVSRDVLLPWRKRSREKQDQEHPCEAAGDAPGRRGAWHPFPDGQPAEGKIRFRHAVPSSRRPPRRTLT